MRGSVRRSAAFPRALGTRSSPQDDGARPADTGPSLSCRIKRWGVAAALILGGLLAGAGGAWAEEMQEVVVKPGDTLWSISQKYLKDPTHWNVI
ncbi:MAG: LysM domain-containing protein, partial [Elusimicrobiota bacterium]